VRLALEVLVPFSAAYLSDYRSSLHTIQEQETPAGRRFVLQPGERLDRDFILRYRIADKDIRSTLALQPDSGGQEGTFLLTLVPPRGAAAGKLPRDVVFVLDQSGSMEGWKIVAARRALARMVETLTEQDRFAVLAFSSGVRTPAELGGKLRPASDRNRFLAAEFLAGLTADGGTEMRQPLEQAVAELSEGRPGQRQRILVLVTDGQVGNEDDILRRLSDRARDIRIFTLGIDRAVNAAFLRRLSDLGGGSCALVESEDRLDEVMEEVHRHIGTPLLTGLNLMAEGMSLVTESVVPGRLPDLFAGTPLMIMGRYRGPLDSTVTMRATDGAGEVWSMRVEASEGSPALASVWARGRLRELEDRFLSSSDRARLEKDIVDLSLRFGVLCRFTAYVAVDREEEVNPSGQVLSMVQPVEHPAGWDGLCAAMPMSASFGFGALAKRSGKREARNFELDRARSVPPPPPACAPAPAETGGTPGDEVTGELMVPRAAKKTYLAKQVLQEANADGRVSKKTQQAVEEAAELHRPDPVQRLRELIQRMRTTDLADRLSFLSDIRTRKQELFGDLFAAGAPRPSLERVGQKLLEMEGLLDAPNPDPSSIWDDLLAALTDLLQALEAEEAAAAPRKAFWK
jgi:Ca-activated chloride channel family protein